MGAIKADQVGNVPFRRLAGNIRRWVRGVFWSCVPIRKSYSSDGEDLEIDSLLKQFDTSNAIYIDIGANDPVANSNTYLFYRKGHSGICLDPNYEYAPMYYILRRRDVFVLSACSNNWGFHRLSGESTSTSSLTRDRDSRYGRIVPVGPADALLSTLDIGKVFLLTIDTEGHDLFVLLGCTQILQLTAFLLCESAAGQDTPIKELLEKSGFIFMKRIGLNLLFRNSSEVLKRVKSG